MKAADIANALTRTGAVFNRRKWVVVPNVSWGWGLDYEADVIAVSQGMWADECEIKVTKADLCADSKKRKFTHGRIDERIKRFWYAVPTSLVDVAKDTAVVPATAGIVEVKAPRESYDFPTAVVVRRPTPRTNARQVTADELQKLLHLGVMRYWDLRLKLQPPTDTTAGAGTG